MTHPDDIGYERAEQRQRAAEDAVQWLDEDDWDDLAGMDLEDQLDALLAVADDERLAYCECCGEIVPADESYPASADPDDDTRICESCAKAEQDAIRAEIDAELDAINDAAATYRAAGIDPQMAMTMARHRMAG